MKTLTEQLPSSGASSHEHKWQKVEGGSDKADEIMLVCGQEGCNVSKVVKKPALKEDKVGKTLLLG